MLSGTSVTDEQAGEHPSRETRLKIRRWGLWSLPRRALGYVLGIELLALVAGLVVVLNGPAPTNRDLLNAAILIIVIGAALITPSGDAFSLLVLSVPLYLMYEAGGVEIDLEVSDSSIACTLRCLADAARSRSPNGLYSRSLCGSAAPQMVQ